MKYFALLFLLFFQPLLNAQKAPIKWKEIPIEDLQMTDYSHDKSAAAVVLCDYGQYYFDLNPNGRNLFLFNRRHVRIKILKEEGIKYSKVKVSFINMSCAKHMSENSAIIKGMVYNLTKNGKLEASKLKAKNISYRDSSDCIRIAEFELPNVKVGSVIDYYIEQPTFDFLSPKSWYFQWDIPVVHSELRMRVPRYFQYMFEPLNFENFDSFEETSYSHTLLFNARFYRYYQRTHHFDMSGSQMQFIKKNIEAFEYQKFMYNPKNYYQRLKIHLVRATNENLGGAWKYITHALFTTLDEKYDEYDPLQKSSIFYPAGFILYQMPDWEKFTQKLLKSERFGLPLIKHWEYQPYLDSIIKDKTSDFEKMQAIYDFVHENMSWTGKQSIFVKSVFNPDLAWLYTKITRKLIKEKSLGKPFKNKKGSNSEINFILISLLNKAGIKTYPVIISTRDNFLIDSNIPDPKQFNNVLALSKIGEDEYLLDATDSLRPYNLLDKSQIGIQGFLVDEKDFGWLEIKNKAATRTNIIEKIEIDSNSNLSREITIEKTGYDAFNTRKTIDTLGYQNVLDSIVHQIGDVEIDNVINLDKSAEPLVFEANEEGKFINNEYKIRIKLNPIYSETDFTDDFRKYPVEFEYPFTRSYSLVIKAPEGFEIIIPDAKGFSTYGKNARYTYQVIKEGDLLKINIVLEIKKISFPATEYSNLAKIFEELNELIKKEIIIRKTKET